MADKLSDMDTAVEFWTLLKQQKREVREFLAAKLEESLKKEEKPKKAVSLAEASDFVRALAVHGEEEVPPDEKGIFALLDEKY